MIKYKPKPMTKGQFASLKMIYAYNIVDERKHWENTGKPETGHIYNDLERINDYIYNCEQFVGSKTDDD